jgi:hypothetical protein
VRSGCSCETCVLRDFINVDDLTNSKKAHYGSRGFNRLGSARGSTSTSDLSSRTAVFKFEAQNEQCVQTATISTSRVAEPAVWMHLYAIF